MRVSFATALKFDGSGADSSSEFAASTNANTVGALGSAFAEQPTGSSSSFSIPTFAGYGDVYAIESRRAGRLNAATASEQEYQSLLRERQRLLDKKLNETISPRESNRLEYVRWSLDRIEDARSGEALDLLENLVSQYEQFRRDVGDLTVELSKHMTGTRK
jgi:hypothetical protein